MKALILAALVTTTAIAGLGFRENPATADDIVNKLNVAIVNDKGSLKRPENLDQWIFMGQTIGMTYIEGQPDPDDIGYMSTVLMEPQAYQVFLETGEFPEGTIFAKVVRETLQEGGGFFMGEEVALEIHLKDKEMFPKHGFNFWFFTPDEEFASAMPADNVCVSCHIKTAQYDNFFTQYYPTIRHKIPKQ